MTSRPAIAIDGPAASGKTTIGLLLAARLKYLCLDTGVFYRALTAEALETGIDPLDEKAVVAMAWGADVKVEPPAISSQELTILVNGHDLSAKLRSPLVNRWVSEVSAYQGVRAAMLNIQRQVGEQGGVILLGRDIGTVVLPDAVCKIYLTASAEERAKRRYLEDCLKGTRETYEEILASIRHRDTLDSSRQAAPLKPAENAFIFNTDGLRPDEVVEGLLEFVLRVCPQLNVPPADETA